MGRSVPGAFLWEGTLSGWIKLEKDLREDIRVRRMAVTLCNAGAFHGVTLVLGGLTQLWMHADSFAREDDTLDITADEIDQLTGIEGFAKALPVEWLQVIDANTVKLPGFHDHNGSEAKRRALTAKRVAQHRDNKKRTIVTGEPHLSNADALPDQTRPDKTRPSKNRTAASPPSDDAPRETHGWMLEFKLAYPERAGDQGWPKALRAANARIAEGHTPDELIAGAKRYAAFCDATGRTKSEYVKQACTFLGPDKPFLLPWHPPPKPENASERILRHLNGTDESRVIEHEPDTIPLAIARQ